MISMTDYVMRIKPAMESFLRNPNKQTLSGVEKELSNFNWAQLQIFHVQVLAPLVLKLEKLNGIDQDLQAGTMDCIRLVVSKLYLKDLQGLKSMLMIVLKQIRDFEQAKTRENLSEEIKLAAVDTINTILQRSTTDLLEKYYTKDSALFLGQILLTLVDFIEKEKYKKLVISSLNCLMTIFYVHDSSEEVDVVLRSQVANTLFIFLPKIVTILFKICLSDEKFGETLITTSIKTLGRILTLMFEDSSEAIKKSVDVNAFKELINEVQTKSQTPMPSDEDVLGTKVKKDQIEESLKKIQMDGRSKYWFRATSGKLQVIFRQLGILRSHSSLRIRHEFAQICCILIQKSGNNLSHNFIYMLENVLAMAEDEDEAVRRLCQQTLSSLQCCKKHESLFDESAELLFDEHLTRLPRIISRSDDNEQYGELLFLNGFLRNLSAEKLQHLFSMRRNLEMFCACLLTASDLRISRNLLIEEYSLRTMEGADFEQCAKLRWRQFKNLCSPRSVRALQNICGILGRALHLNEIIFDHLLEILMKESECMNEVIMLLIWMITEEPCSKNDTRRLLIDKLMNEICKEKHWHLALKADQMSRLKVDKPSNWFVDRTPGLYESAIEIRIQDCDSDDDIEPFNRRDFVSVSDAQFNVLHTCIILDALGHCALALGESMENYLFRCLHNVLLKVGSSNSIVYESGIFALISMQRALKFTKIVYFIETYTDYITYHMNRLLKRQPEDSSCADIMTVVLRFCTRNALPHLDNIFQTIRDECSKSYQNQNIPSFLRVFITFLSNVHKWKIDCNKEVDCVDVTQMETASLETNALTNWLSILNRQEDVSPITEDANSRNPISHEVNEEQMEIDMKEASSDPVQATVPSLSDSDKLDRNIPQYIQVVKDILEQATKFLSSSIQIHQILSLECLICGLPLLNDYEDELLPLVHKFWQPLVERFRHKDAIVLNRCFTLLNVTASHAKEFITKRSIDDVIPYLVRFLKEAAVRSPAEISAAQTQEYKLQVKLLQDFPNLIEKMQIEGKNLTEISEAIAIYLCRNQPQCLQKLAEEYFMGLRCYNGPLIYIIVLKKSHVSDYKQNACNILQKLLMK